MATRNDLARLLRNASPPLWDTTRAREEDEFLHFADVLLRRFRILSGPTDDVLKVAVEAMYQRQHADSDVRDMDRTTEDDLRGDAVAVLEAVLGMRPVRAPRHPRETGMGNN